MLSLSLVCVCVCVDPLHFPSLSGTHALQRPVRGFSSKPENRNACQTERASAAVLGLHPQPKTLNTHQTGATAVNPKP
jgi:hypothetical protein